MSASDKEISKFLSYVLRHNPKAAGLTLDAGGWVPVDAVIAGAPMALTPDRIAQVVQASDKQRFALSEDGTRIRANQGHSVPVDLGLAPLVPPEVLYHGTAATSVPAILTEGLSPRTRQHVHLSEDVATARQVGQRHGTPAILKVEAGLLHRDGQTFFQSQNGVWLTGPVAAGYLSLLPDQEG